MMTGSNDDLRLTKFLYFYVCSECHGLVKGLLCPSCGKEIKKSDIYQYELKKIIKKELTKDGRDIYNV